MNHIDLCSGIGGFAKAARQMGWQTIAFCERELFCHQVLRKNFDNVPIFNDLHNLTYAAIRSVYRHYGYAAPDIGIVTAGLPCQPFSGAGKQLGRKDERHLFPAFLNFIRSFGSRKPKFIVLENVRRLVSIEDGQVLAEITACLESEGYFVWPPFIIPACAVDAPHRRDRIWLVAMLIADADDERRIGRSEQRKSGERPLYEGRRNDRAFGESSISDRVTIADALNDGNGVSGQRRKVCDGNRGSETKELGRHELESRSFAHDRGITTNAPSPQNNRIRRNCECGRHSVGRPIETALGNNGQTDHNSFSGCDCATPNPKSERPRKTRGLRRHESTQRATGGNQVIANTQSEGRQIGRLGRIGELSTKGRKRMDDRPDLDGSESITNASNTRLQRRELGRTLSQRARASRSVAQRDQISWSRPWTEIVGELCRVHDELPSWLDGGDRAAIYQAVKHFGREETERKTGLDCSKVAQYIDRADRLKSLGNAIVPEIPYQIFLALQEAIDTVLFT